MINVTAYEHTKDYVQISRWWTQRGLPPVAKILVNVQGSIAYDESTGKMLAAGWLYKESEGNICWMTHIVTNPDCVGRQAYEGIKAVTNHLCESARAQGYGMVITATSLESLSGLYQKLGFVEDDSEKHTLLVKGLL